MKIHSVVRSWSHPFFVKYRTHYCPDCKEKLKKINISKVVNSRSKEAKEHDFEFPSGDGYMIGNVKFICTEFHCPNCEKNYSVDYLYKIARGEK